VVLPVPGLRTGPCGGQESHPNLPD
jgi:hypothetical protein